MPSKTYTEEFKRDAVALYENFLEASIHTIATDLGISRATLANWVRSMEPKPMPPALRLRNPDLLQ